MATALPTTTGTMYREYHLQGNRCNVPTSPTPFALRTWNALRVIYSVRHQTGEVLGATSLAHFISAQRQARE